jgi:hypothetical protein
MTEEQGYKIPGAFDVTKVWSHKVFPLIEYVEFVVGALFILLGT